MRMSSFCINKAETRISCAVVAQLVSAFVFSLQRHDYSFAFKTGSYNPLIGSCGCAVLLMVGLLAGTIDRFCWDIVTLFIVIGVHRVVPELDRVE